NDPSHKFCFECGTPLANRCSSCGHENPPGHRFCSECGTALDAAEPEAPTPAREPGERRFVSVLFADLVGFTTFSESRDPEEVRAMLTRYFDRARETIERFGGEVDKFIGDAVTAFWGAHQASEDDAERAVRAALELVDTVSALGEELGIPEMAVRAGVLSGETSVGVGGNEKGLVVGDIVNTASRLQSAAEAGTVLVGDSTRQLTEAAIRYEPAGELEMKGKADKVTAWRALSVVGQRGGKNRWEALEPPFVGRGEEFRLLKDQLHATSRDRTARLVSIVGEAGIGKSRLAWELLKYVDGLSESFRWHQGRSPAYGDGVTFWALAEMVRSRAGIAENEEPTKARTRLRTAVAEHVPDSEEQQWIEPRLAGLLGLDEMPSGDRNELFAAIRTFFQRLADEQTTVLLFEDLHWADSGQLDFIEELIEMSQGHPILVITLARPELLDRQPQWGTARNRFLSVRLGPIGDAAMRDLVAGMAPGIPADVVDLIVSRAGGVPLYAVEYVRMLINTGDLILENGEYHPAGELGDVALPDSLHAVVGARLDRLDEKHRALVQDAAVLGQSFSLEGLTVLTGRKPEELEPDLRDLSRRELFRFDSDPRSPERGQYHFLQSVIREVAYGRIAKADRKDRHLKVAAFYERESPVEAAAVIASHYMSAYDAGPDEELASRARQALTNAAERALDLKSFAQSLALIEHALQVPGTEAQQAALWKLAPVAASALFHHTEAIDYARKALDWYEEHGEPADVVRAANVLGTAYIDADEPIQAVAAMQPHFEAGRAVEPEMASLGAELARAHMRSAQAQESAEVALAVLEAAEVAGNHEVAVDALNTRGIALADRGRSYEGIAMLREALRLAEQHALPYATLRAINNLLVTEGIHGVASGKDLIARGYQLAQRVRHGALLVRAIMGFANQQFEDGDFDGALETLEELDLGESSWAQSHDVFREQLLWVKTGDPAHIEGAERANLPLLEHPEPQYRGGAVDTQVGIAWARKEWPKVLELAPQVEPFQPWNSCRHLALGASLLLGDADAVRSVLEMVGTTFGRRFDVLRFAGAAALEALEGSPAQAAAMFVDLIQQFEAVESPQMAATWRAIFGAVLPDRPEAAEAARRAYAWFTEKGAQGYLDLYSDVWALHLPEAAAEAG
ncbi:MAG TPA: adenylate/guanylate cyclase domain-containing protein, partial [Thermoanaerobaculia bacterium]|nr:adenylate/guanylate cyclase domain-containing protein [Thermoanaerobaculia bacterium]